MVLAAAVVVRLEMGLTHLEQPERPEEPQVEHQPELLEAWELLLL